MNVFNLFILPLAIASLTIAVESRRRNRPKKPKKQQIFNQILKQDPTDLSNLMKGVCPQYGRGLNMNALFEGMFLSETKLDKLVNATQDELSEKSMRRTRNRYVQRNRLSKTIATTRSLPAVSASSSGDETCCETELRITAPGQVMVDGRSMSVVHMNHSYQYVQEGECITPGATCRGIGICTQRYKYAFMLLYDPELVGRVNPPVRYGEVAVKSHCECMNIGRVM